MKRHEIARQVSGREIKYYYQNTSIKISLKLVNLNLKRIQSMIKCGIFKPCVFAHMLT